MNFRNIFRTKARGKPEADPINERGITYSFGTGATEPITIKGIMNSNEALKVSTVFRCTTLIANSVAALSLRMFKQDSSGYGKEVNDRRLTNILKNPNKVDTGYKLWQKAIVKVIKDGEAVIEIIRDEDYNPTELRLAENCSVMLSTTAYDYLYTISDRFGSRPVPSSDVIHLTGVITDANCVPRSIFNFASDVLNLGTSAQEYLSYYFDNGLFQQGVLTTEKKLNDVQKKQLKDSWKLNTGLTNIASTPILPEGIEYKKISTNPDDTGALEIINATRAETARYFGVPLEKLNLKDKSQAVDVREEQTFYQDCLKAYVTEIEQEVSKKLFFRSSQKDMYVKFDDSYYTAVTKEFAEAQAKLVQIGILSPNEARKRQNLPPVEGGDDVYMNYIPLNKTQEYFSKENINKNKDNEQGNKKPEPGTDS